MPFKSATYQRYKTVIAFVAVTLGFVLACVAFTVSINRAGDASRTAKATAHDAKALALQVKRQQAQFNAENDRRRRLRTRQIADLKAIARKSCHDRHVINGVLSQQLRTSRALIEASPPFPGLTPPQQAELERRNQQYLGLIDRELADLKKADCLQPPKPKVPAG